jgi:phage gpG-like protein
MPPTPSVSARRLGGSLGGFITFDWAPNPKILAAKLNEAAAKLEHVAEPLGLSREVVMADVENHFATESGPDGAPWQPWSDSYAERTEASSILTLTGEMRGAVQNRGAWPIDGNDLFFSGAGVPPRWAWHQEGRVRTRKGVGPREEASIRATHAQGLFAKGVTVESLTGNVLPARPFIGMSEDAKAQVISIFDEWVAGIIAGVTFASGRTQARSVATGRFTRIPGA